MAAPATKTRAPVAPSYASWQLLNPYTAREAHTTSFGLVGYRPLPEQRESVGYSLAIGESLMTLHGAFATGGHRENELRFVPKDSLSLALSRYQWEGGLRLGPLEPMVRVGFTLLHLDVGHGFSFGMFSPRVGAGLWLALPKMRIGVSAFSEYFWRWVGDDSAFVHGLTLEVQLTTGPLLRPRATSSPSSPSRR
jgi:hypothetical protein